MKKILFVILAMILMLSVFSVQVRQTYASDVTPPPVPTDLQVPEGNVAFLVGHATGTQNYVCLPSGSGVKFTLFTPQATLFDDEGGQIITHYFSPDPFENNTIRATWQYWDTSIVRAKLHQNPTGSATVDPNAIPWLLLDAVKPQNGPTGGDTLAKTTFIQRLNTSGGLAPSTGCSSPADVGNEVFIPYTADYFFYKATKGN